MRPARIIARVRTPMRLSKDSSGRRSATMIAGEKNSWRGMEAE